MAFRQLAVALLAATILNLDFTPPGTTTIQTTTTTTQTQVQISELSKVTSVYIDKKDRDFVCIHHQSFDEIITCYEDNHLGFIVNMKYLHPGVSTWEECLQYCQYIPKDVTLYREQTDYKGLLALQDGELSNTVTQSQFAEWTHILTKKKVNPLSYKLNTKAILKRLDYEEKFQDSLYEKLFSNPEGNATSILKTAKDEASIFKDDIYIDTIYDRKFLVVPIRYKTKNVSWKLLSDQMAITDGKDVLYYYVKDTTGAISPWVCKASGNKIYYLFLEYTPGTTYTLVAFGGDSIVLWK